jgi:peptidoglycan-associated lipoprotein
LRRLEMRRFVFALIVGGVAMGGTTACATKSYVQGRVGEVNSKVETLSESLEETQERTRRNEARIGEVDQKAAAAAEAASEAHGAADNAKGLAEEAGARADEVERHVKRLVYEVVLSEDQSNFRFGATELPDEAKARLDEVVAQLKAEPTGAYIEVEGHTDSIGTAEVNNRIGMERAEAVKRYLYEAHQVPLHKINVFSYGKDKPIAPNNTSAGRAQNRRVVIRVLT